MTKCLLLWLDFIGNSPILRLFAFPIPFYAVGLFLYAFALPKKIA